MKFFKNLLVFLFFLLVGFGGLYTYLSANPQIKTVNLKEVFNGSKFSLLNAPSQSLKGEIKNLQGEVLWKNRISDSAIKIDNLLSIQQGEGIETGEDGFVDINYLDTAHIKVFSKTKLDIIQTLPANLVFKQSSGQAIYQKISTIPVSVRIAPVLIEVLGEVTVNLDDVKNILTVKGFSKIAFNNNSNITRIIELKNDETLTINLNTLKVVLK